MSFVKNTKFIYPSVNLLAEISKSIKIEKDLIPSGFDAATIKAHIIMAVSKAYPDLLFEESLVSFFKNEGVRESLIFRNQRLEYILDGFTEEHEPLFESAQTLVNLVHIDKELTTSEMATELKLLIRSSIFACMTDIFDARSFDSYCNSQARQSLERWVF